jgi:phage gpG-like protein
MTEFDLGFDADAVVAALADQAETAQADLEARIRGKLSGEVLHVRSGALLGSINTEVEDDDGSINITAGSSGVPYAAILEHGGKTAAHEIVAVKAKALAFLMGGARVFAKSVHHPGSLIRAYAYLSGTLDEAAGDMEANLTHAIYAALGAD